MKQKIVNYGKEKRIKILEKSKLLSDEYLKIKDEQQAKTDLLLDAEHLTKHTSTPWCTFKDHDNKYMCFGNYNIQLLMKIQVLLC